MQSQPASPGKGLLTGTCPGQCQSIQRWHSTAAAPLWDGQSGSVVSENAWKEHLPQVDSPFLNYHHPAVVLGCSTEDSRFFPLWSSHGLMVSEGRVLVLSH